MFGFPSTEIHKDPGEFMAGLRELPLGLWESLT